VCDPPLHLDLHNTSTRIEEVIESHILQVREVATPNEEVFLQDIFKVFTAEKTKCPGKASEFSAPPPPPPAPVPLTSAPAQPPPTASSAPQSNMQYWYQSNAKDQQLISELEEYLMKGKLSLTTPAHVFTASHAIHKNITEKLKVCCVETNKYKVVPTADLRLCLRCTTVHYNFSNDLPLSDDCSPEFCLPLLELDALFNSSFKSPAILDTSLQIVIIQHNIVQSLGFPINSQCLIEMEGANSATNWMVGCAKNLLLQVGDVTIKVHAHVIEHTSFGLLLGHPFQKSALLRFEDLPSGEIKVSVCDPTNLEHRVYIPTCPHTGRAPAVSVISVLNLVPSLLHPMQATVQCLIPPLVPATHSTAIPKYTQLLPTKHPKSLVFHSSPEVFAPPPNTSMGNNFLTQQSSLSTTTSPPRDLALMTLCPQPLLTSPTSSIPSFPPLSIALQALVLTQRMPTQTSTTVASARLDKAISLLGCLLYVSSLAPTALWLSTHLATPFHSCHFHLRTHPLSPS